MSGRTLTAHRFEEMTKQMVGSQHSRRRLLRKLGGGLAGAALTGAGPSMAGSQEATSAARVTGNGDVAGLVDIGGRLLYLECRGAGGPTVVLEAGYRSPVDVWTTDLVSPETPRTMVFAGVAANTRTCVYERPGVAAVIDGVFMPSRSDPAPVPRTAADAVAALHTLLDVADVPGPYVLVGHSFGGLIVRLYASTYPNDVAGLVLVDALSEYVRTELTPEEWAAYAAVVSAVPPELTAYASLETMDMDASFDQMTEASSRHPLTGIPLTVISAGLPFGIPDADLGFSSNRLQDAWSAAQDKLGSLIPDTRHLVATDSAHYVQLDQPNLVIEAIRQVVNAVRDPDTRTPDRATPGSSTWPP